MEKSKKINGKARGKIIVIDGVDGSGKKTQVAMLLKRLKKDGIKVATLDFPQYENNFIGKNIKEFLTHPEYTFHKQHPKVFSIILAADRWESKQKIEKYLDQGYLVILDRYMSSNQIHQGGKIKDEKKWEEFMTWLDTLEFKVFKIPRPNLILYLNLKIANIEKMLKLRGNFDNAEKDLQHQAEAIGSAIRLAKKYKIFNMINCDDEKSEMGIKSRVEINYLIYSQIKKYI